MKVLYHFILILYLVQLFACTNPSKGDLIGLYELSRLNVDGRDRPNGPEYIAFRKDHTFALSQMNGDDLGFYSLHGNVLKLVCESGGRFNARWRLMLCDTYFTLDGLDEGYRVTHLTYRRINQVPHFTDFEQRVLGKWQIYKVRDQGQIKRVFHTVMNIGAARYEIIEHNTVMEVGSAIIDARHQRIVFENEQVTWRVWFYGEELRLTNDQKDLQYDLRRVL